MHQTKKSWVYSFDPAASSQKLVVLFTASSERAFIFYVLNSQSTCGISQSRLNFISILYNRIQRIQLG